MLSWREKVIFGQATVKESEVAEVRRMREVLCLVGACGEGNG